MQTESTLSAMKEELNITETNENIDTFSLVYHIELWEFVLKQSLNA